ncbi:MAG: chemotaxis protein CheW [Bdellovibrionia bacterium]
MEKKNLNRFLNFSLGNEDYAIPLLGAKEVIAMPEITPIPAAPKYFLGIMNLRGQVISIIDLREKLGIRSGENREENAVIILNLDNVYIGVIVDSIKTVLSLSQDDLSVPTEVGRNIQLDYISHFARYEGKLISILNIAKALDIEEITNATNQFQKAA